MAEGNGSDLRTDEHGIGSALADISEKATLLVQEEIELAKAEISGKVNKILRGGVVGIAAGIFALLAILGLVNAFAWGLAEIFGNHPWIGFLGMTALMLILAGAAGLFAARSFKTATPPVPQMAIEEARRTKEAIST